MSYTDHAEDITDGVDGERAPNAVQNFSGAANVFGLPLKHGS